jgi:hypothetical protein
MNDTPTPRTDETEKIADKLGSSAASCGFTLARLKEIEMELIASWEEAANAKAECLKACLREQLTYEDMKFEKNRADDALLELNNVTEQRDRLAEAIRLTLMENLDLCDGDICTLKRLKDAVGFDLDSLENASAMASADAQTHTEGIDFMIPENTDTPLMADCPSAPCSALEFLAQELGMPAEHIREAARNIARKRMETKHADLMEKVRLIRDKNTAILPTGEIVARDTPGAMPYDSPQNAYLSHVEGEKRS